MPLGWWDCGGLSCTNSSGLSGRHLRFSHSFHRSLSKQVKFIEAVDIMLAQASPIKILNQKNHVYKHSIPFHTGNPDALGVRGISWGG